MGRWAASILVAIVALIAAVLIVPSLIDWNGFRAPIEREASRLIGREVKIKGDIRLRMLPSPGFVFNTLTIADPKDPKAPLLSAGRLEASAAWLPLLQLHIEIAHFGLSQPVIRVRITKDGKTNWSVRDARYQTRSQPLPAPRGAQRSDLTSFARGFADEALASLKSLKLPKIFSTSRLSFRDIWIDRGTLLFADDRNGANSKADKISGRFNLAKAQGPLTGQVAFDIGGQSMRIAINVISVAGRRWTPLTATLTFLDSNGTLTLRGTASGLNAAARSFDLAPFKFRAKLDLRSPQSASVGRGLLSLAQFDTAPAKKQSASRWRALRSLPVTLTGTLQLTSNALSLSDAKGALGRTHATVAWTRGRKSPLFNLNISSDVLYLSELVDFKAPSGMRFAPLGAISGPTRSFSLCHCEGEAKLTARRVEVPPAALSDLVIDVKLSPDSAELTQAHVTMPGDSTLDASGTLPAQPQEGAIFDGQVDFASANPRLLLEWLGVSTERISPNVFKSVSVAGPFKLIDRQASAESGLRGTVGAHYLVPLFDDVTLALDEQSYKLTASYDDRVPRRLLFHMSGDWLDADAYGLSGLWLPKAPFKGEGWRRTLWGRSARAGDVDLDIKLGQLRLARHSMSGFAASVKRVSGGASTGHLDIKDVSGYHVSFDGERTRDEGDAPPDISAHLGISGKGSLLTLPLAGKGLPGSLKLDLTLAQTKGSAKYALTGTMGEIKLDGTGNGPASIAAIPDIEALKVSVHLSQGDALLTGSLRGLSSAPDLDASLTVDALDFPAFMRELGYTYQPRRKDLGALSLVSQFAVNGDRLDVASFSASVGKDSLTAQGSVTFAGRPRVVADVKVGRASLEGYLPAPDKASKWSAERLKVDVAKRFDGSVHLTADRFVIGPYDLRKLEAGLYIQDSLIQTKAAKATLYGGALNFSGAAKVTKDGLNTSMQGRLAGFDWPSGARKLFPALGAVGGGKANAHFNVTASGRSLSALVSSLSGPVDVSGSGAVLNGFDLSAWSQGIADVGSTSSFLRLVKSALGKGSTAIRTFNISGTARKGVIRLGTSHLALAGGDGALSGDIDLPKRNLSLKLAVQSTEHKEVAPVGLIVAGPIAGPARFYDVKDASASIARRLGVGPDGIRPSDAPKDLRDMLQRPPGS